MLTALFVLTFVVGFVLGAIAIVAVCTYLINKDRSRNSYMEAINRGKAMAYAQMSEHRQRTGQNPFV